MQHETHLSRLVDVNVVRRLTLVDKLIPCPLPHLPLDDDSWVLGPIRHLRVRTKLMETE